MQPSTFFVLFISGIRVRVNAKWGGQPCQLIEEWYNFATSSWDSIKTFALSRSDRNCDAWGPGPSNYLNSTMNMRIRFRLSSEYSFNVYIDYLAVTFSTIVDVWGN
jgi:hypothetical protein